jgi:DinB family protein
MTIVLSEAIPVLRCTPATLSALLSGLGDEWLGADEGPDTFTPRDVIGHLISGEETDWIPRLRIILESGERRPFTPFDRFGFRQEYGHHLTIGDLLDRFAALREDNLRQLEGLRLTPAQLELRGTHPELGTVTLSQLLATWVGHDLTHLSQVVRVMARRYEQAVGPWRAYLRILQPA